MEDVRTSFQKEMSNQNRNNGHGEMKSNTEHFSLNILTSRRQSSHQAEHDADENRRNVSMG